MKKPINLLKISWLGIITLFATANLYAQYSVTLPYKNVTVENKDGVASFDGAILSGESGEPALPQYSVSFLLPAGADLDQVSVDIVNPVYSDLDGLFEVTPLGPAMANDREIWPADKTIVDGKDVAIYNNDAYFPSDFKGFVSKGKISQYGITEVVIHPFRYNPVTKKLRVITGGNIVVTIANGPQDVNSAMNTEELTAPRSAEYEEILKEKVVNFDVVATYNSSQSQSSVNVTGPGKYIIIAGGPFAMSPPPELVEFAERKLLTYDDVMLVTPNMTRYFKANTWEFKGWATVDLGKGPADNIRNWIKTNRYNYNITNVLLIGNPDPVNGDVPMKMTWPRNTEPIDKEAPTDYYYAEFDGNWDKDGDGVIGTYNDFVKGGGALKYPDVNVGRIPYYGNQTDLSKILNKINLYETEQARQWRRNVLLPMEPSSAYMPAWQMGEKIRTDIVKPLGLSSYRLYDQINPYTGQCNDLPLNNPGPGPAGLPTNPENLDCTEANVTYAWKNNTYGLVVWWTHGSSQSAGDVLTSADAPLLKDNYPSMTFQVSCNNSWPEDPQNLAYSLLLNGAVNTIGATRVASYDKYWVLQNGTGYSIGLGYEYAKNVLNYNKKAAAALNDAKSFLPVTNNSHWMNRLVFNIYGTPDLTLNLPPSVIGPPSNLTVSALSGKIIELTWNLGTGNPTGMIVECATGDGDYKVVENLNTIFTHVTIVGKFETKYKFRIRQYNNQDVSFPSNEVTAVILPGPITSFKATAISPTQVKLHWTDNENTLAFYCIERLNPDGTSIQNSGFGSGLRTWIDDKASPGTYYKYKIAAYDNLGYGDWSSQQEVTTPSPSISIIIVPQNASVPAGTTQQFTATAYDQNGNVISPQPTFYWSVNGGGTIDQSGLFTAGNTEGPFTVSATVNNSIQGTATGLVTPAPVLTKIVVSPQVVTLQTVGATQQFSAMGFDQNDNTMPLPGTIIWSVNSGGTINQSGLFTLGSTAESPFTVTASLSGSPLQGFASVFVSSLKREDYHAEALPRTASAIGAWVTTADGAGNNAYVEFSGIASVNDYIEFLLPNISAGAYTVKMKYIANTNGGKCQASIDGVDQGGVCDEYSCVSKMQVPFDIGTIIFSGGDHTIRFRVTGKNQSSSAYAMTIDEIVLIPLQPVTFEAEDLARTSSLIGSKATTNTPGASNNAYVEFNGNACVNDYIEFTLPNITAGTYNVKMYYKSNDNRGQCQLSIDGVFQGGVCDEYATSPAMQVPFDMGSKVFADGGHTIRFMVTGKNPCSCGFSMTIDKIVLTPLKSIITFETEALTRTSSAVGSKATTNASGASNNAYVEFAGTSAIGDYVEFTLPNITASAYNVKMYYKSNNNRGQCRVSIDGVSQGGVCDEYAASPVFQVPFDMGIKVFTNGDHSIRFTVMGKNVSSSAYAMTIDKIELTPQ